MHSQSEGNKTREFRRASTWKVWGWECERERRERERDTWSRLLVLNWLCSLVKFAGPNVRADAGQKARTDAFVGRKERHFNVPNALVEELDSTQLNSRLVSLLKGPETLGPSLSLSLHRKKERKAAREAEKCTRYIGSNIVRNTASNTAGDLFVQSGSKYKESNTHIQWHWETYRHSTFYSSLRCSIINVIFCHVSRKSLTHFFSPMSYQCQSSRYKDH